MSRWERTIQPWRRDRTATLTTCGSAAKMPLVDKSTVSAILRPLWPVLRDKLASAGDLARLLEPPMRLERFGMDARLVGRTEPLMELLYSRWWRVAVAGAGSFGSNHLRVLRELESASAGVALVAAVEPNSARAAETAAQYNIPVFPTVEKLLAADLKLDASSVAVPTVHHHAVASELLDAGLDLLVEKPLAAQLTEADDLISRADRNLANARATL